MTAAHVVERGLGAIAPLGGVGAAGGEHAPLGEIQRGGHRAGDHMELLPAAPLGQRGLQPLGIGVEGLGKDGGGGALLHHVPAVEHQGAAAQLADHPQVVGDEGDGGAQLVPELAHQVQDLGLDGYVQGGGGLVGDEQLRPAGQGHGDHHPLAQAARELIGVAVHPFFGHGHVDHAQGFDGLLPGLLLIEALMEAKDLHELVPHGKDRIERGHGLLKDHGHPVAPDVAEVLHGHIQQALAVKLDAAGDPGVLLGQAHDGQGRHALAAARLAHDAQGLPLVDIEGQDVEDVQGGGVGLDGDMQVLYMQCDVVVHASASLTSFWGPTGPAGRRPGC